jgi:hypothetical protein
MQESVVPILDVDWADLELAFRDATGTENYLDLDTGEVVSIVPGFSDEAELREQLGRDPSRYLDLPPIDTTFARRVMKEFIETLPKEDLRRKLEVAFRKTGALTRCMEHLRGDERSLGSYHRFEQLRFWTHVEAMLRLAGIRPQTSPPSVELFEGSMGSGSLG